jgi:hypothetical protein
MRLWDSLSGPDKDYVTAQEFREKFLHASQKEMDATVRDVKALFTSINRMEVSREETLSIRRTVSVAIDSQATFTMSSIWPLILTKLN